VRRPLEGIRVIDLSRLLPGPMCSWYLVGLGASVTKIESPDGADYLRFMPPHRSDGMGAWFSAIHAGKESVALNLKRSNHLEALFALLSDADVLIESFRPGVLDRLGLAPEDLREQFPRLIICSITGFGQSGPLRDAPGHDLGYQALAGGLSMAERRDGVMDVPGIQIADLAGGSLTAALRIAAALVAREQTGEGAWLDVSMTEGMLAMVAPVVAGTAASGTDPQPGAEVLTGGNAQYRVYACKDGRSIAVAALEPKFWDAFNAAVGGSISPDSVVLESFFKERTRDAWVELLGGACCEPVLEVSELASHPQHVARGALTGDGENIRVSHPFEGGAQTAQLPAPTMGADTERALRRVGFDPARLEDS
jgi:alpha-methylacyl-CoA racemase